MIARWKCATGICTLEPCPLICCSSGQQVELCAVLTILPYGIFLKPWALGHNFANKSHMALWNQRIHTRLTLCLICCCSLLIVFSVLIRSVSFLVSFCWTVTFSLSLDCSCSSCSQELEHSLMYEKNKFTFSLSCC